MGRPKSNNPKSVEYGIRLDIETELALKEYCENNGVTKGEAIRKAIRLMLNAKTD